MKCLGTIIQVLDYQTKKLVTLQEKSVRNCQAGGVTGIYNWGILCESVDGAQRSGRWQTKGNRIYSDLISSWNARGMRKEMLLIRIMFN